jgi:copper chaperone CopZ
MDEDCHADPPENTLPAAEQACIRIVRLVVWGMYCPGCGTRIHGRLAAVKGVLEVYVDHTIGIVEVVFNSNLTTTVALIDAVVRAGDDGRHTFGASVSNTLLSGTCLQNWRQRNIH